MLKLNTSAQYTKLAIAAGLLSFGATWLFAPQMLEEMFARNPGAHLPIVTLAIGGLGAHALAAGLFAAFARFKSWTYPGFALSLLPVFAADYWFHAKAGVFNELTFVHAGGMLVILALCARGFRLLQRDESTDALPA
jgi:hypothetical protein